jgi:hypothetical protein
VYGPLWWPARPLALARHARDAEGSGEFGNSRYIYSDGIDDIPDYGPLHSQLRDAVFQNAALRKWLEQRGRS